jgi:NitT/TauT family transport system substrate-binding protein
VRGIAALLSIALLLAGTALPAAADDTLTVIGASTTAGFYEVLDHVAELAGFYKDEHLIVQKQYITAAASVAQLVGSGKADIASLSVEPLILGYEKGLRLQYFFGSDPQYVYVLGVLDDSPIRTLADFKGKEIGEITLGSAAEVMAQSMLAGAGLRPGDYAFVPIGTGTQALTAVVNGKVAGSAFPGAALVQQGIEGHVKWRFFRHPILKDVGTYGFAALPATIQTKGDQLRRFSRAIARAAVLIRENPELAARYYLQGAGFKLTDEAIRNQTLTLEQTQGDLPAADPLSKKIGYMPPVGMAVYCTFLHDSGLTSQVVPASAIVTNQFIDFANDYDHPALIARVKNMR